jgi:hypothetical protein
MSWEYILKADFSFRDVVKNSRGVYAGIFDRIQDTPDLSVTDKRKAAEVVLMEPILIGIDMMNDPSMEKDIDNLRESRVTNIAQEEQDDTDEEADLTDAQITTIQGLADKAANKVVFEMRKNVTKTIQDKLGEELSGQEKHEITQGLIEVVSSQEFIGYVAVVLSALIRKMAKESEDKAKESEFEVEVDDRGFSEDFMEANKMDWFSYLKE